MADFCLCCRTQHCQEPTHQGGWRHCVQIPVHQTGLARRRKIQIRSCTCTKAHVCLCCCSLVEEDTVFHVRASLSGDYCLLPAVLHRQLIPDRMWKSPGPSPRSSSVSLPQHSTPHPARGNHIYLLPDKFKYVCPHEHHADWVYTLLGSG